MMAFNDQVAAKGAFAIEAPITGGLEALKKGQMTVLMAGDAQKVKEVSLSIFLSNRNMQCVF